MAREAERGKGSSGGRHTWQNLPNHTHTCPRRPRHPAETALRSYPPLQPARRCQRRVSGDLVLETPRSGHSRVADQPLAVRSIDGNRLHPNKDFVVPWGWFRGLLELNDIRRSVFGVYNRFHCAISGTASASFTILALVSHSFLATARSFACGAGWVAFEATKYFPVMLATSGEDAR